MNTKNHRVPLALALAALFAASLVPISGADTPNTLYTLQLGSAGAPKWTILELNVTEPSAFPQVYYEAPKYRCPMTWGTFFMTGTPADADTYNSLAFDFHSGRTGAEVDYGLFIVNGRRPIVMIDDGAEHCNWMNVTVNYGELPVGTVYMLQYVSGVPFDAKATFRVQGTGAAGVSVVGVSSGTSTIYRNETEFTGTGVIVLSPPWCGMLGEIPCAPEHLNQGGGSGASAELERTAAERFRNHPFWFFQHVADARVSNASVRYPDGSVHYEWSNFASAGGQNVLGGGMGQKKMGAPPGVYQFRIHDSAGVSRWGPPGWWITGADIWFPGETHV
jgi:hypothetical protein